MPDNSPPSTVESLIASAPLTSSELQRYLGRSQPWVSGQLRALGDRVVRLRSGRSVHYALARPAYGSDDRIPVWSADSDGNTTWELDVRPLAQGRFAVEIAAGGSAVWSGNSGDGLYADLPWFLSDLRPQGFIGRRIAKSLRERGARFPEDPRAWTHDHVGRYLVANGDDLPGNLLVGHQASLRVRRPPVGRTIDQYPELATATLQGDTPGSSAGGEQPKFSIYSAERSAHVIVKFSPSASNVSSERWRDILVTEHEAAQALRAHGIPAGDTRLLAMDDRLFLESNRFDRHGEHGRLSMFSLQVVDAEFVGDGSDWIATMVGLHARGLASSENVYDAELLHAFGLSIGNTDMHLGNLSVHIDRDIFRLSPVYDMCSMCLAPTQERAMTIADMPHWNTHPLNGQIEAEVQALCASFWDGVANNEHTSNELRAFAKYRN